MDAAPCGLAWKGGRMGVAWLCLFCACVDSRGRADEDRITKKRKGKKRRNGGEEKAEVKKVVVVVVTGEKKIEKIEGE